MRIGAGILHYRAWPDVQRAIEGLLAQTRQPDEVLLYDHASGDGSVDEIRNAYPDLEVVEAPDNRGPAAGENRVIQTLLARGFDAIFNLPHDIELAPDALER